MRWPNCGELTAGHARALVGREDAVELARQIARDGMTVRDIEGRVSKSVKRKAPKKAAPDKSTDTLALERDLSDVLGLKVSINARGDESSGQGVLAIEFMSFDQLDDVLRRLNRNGRTEARDSAETDGIGIPKNINS